MQPHRFKLVHQPWLRWPALAIALIVMIVGYVMIRNSLAEERLDQEPTAGIIVKYKANTNIDVLRERLTQLRGRNIEEIRAQRLNVLQVAESLQQKTLQDLAADPRVEYAEPDYILNEHATPNDTLYPQQWEWAKIQAPAAWDTTKGSASAIVAVLDSGADLGHQDLAGKLVTGYDFRNGDNEPTDDRSHGTQVSGVIAAATNNQIGVAGGCWQCKIMPIKTSSSEGSSRSSDVIKGIQYAIDNKAKVIVMSFGGPDINKAFADAINLAASRGLVVVASAGNDATGTPQYPAKYDNVISVAATDKNDALTQYSNFGSHIDVAAPGNVQTTSYPDGGYKSVHGTSFSAPIVASLAALLRSGFPNATVADVTKAIMTTTDACCDGKIAGGRVNAAKAMAYLADLYRNPTPTPTPPTPNPTPVPNPTPTTPSSKRADLNGDSRVNFFDLSIILNAWNTTNAKADLNKNGKVDFFDLSILLADFNR